jgi:WD40 repeat protein
VIASPAIAVAQQQVEVAPRLEHGARVTALAAIDDGKVLVGGSRDGGLVLWSRAPEGAAQAAILAKAHDHPVTALACSPDGKVVASGCRGGVLRAWNAATRERLWESRRHTDAIEDACFLPDGTLLTASHDGTVRWWNAANGDELRRVRHDAQVYSLAVAADGATLFSGGDDPGLRIWRLPDGAAVRFVPSRGNRFFALAASVHGHLVAGGSTLTVYTQSDVPGSGRTLRDREHHGWIQSVAFAPDGKRFASGGDDGAVRVWNVATGDEERTWKADAGGVSAVLFVDGGRTVAAADDRGVLLRRP